MKSILLELLERWGRWNEESFIGNHWTSSGQEKIQIALKLWARNLRKILSNVGYDIGYPIKFKNSINIVLDIWYDYLSPEIIFLFRFHRPFLHSSFIQLLVSSNCKNLFLNTKPICIKEWKLRSRQNSVLEGETVVGNLRRARQI